MPDVRQKLRFPVTHLHILLSYLWEDANANADGIVEINVDEIAPMMDMINDIVYIADIPLDIDPTLA